MREEAGGALERLVQLADAGEQLDWQQVRHARARQAPFLPGGALRQTLALPLQTLALAAASCTRQTSTPLGDTQALEAAS